MYRYSSNNPIPRSATWERNDEANPTSKQVTRTEKLKWNCERAIKNEFKQPDQKPRHCEHDSSSFNHDDLDFNQVLGLLKINPYLSINVSPIEANKIKQISVMEKLLGSFLSE